MTVQELIDRLQALPSTAPVLYDGMDARREVDWVHQRLDANTHETYVFLE